MFDSNNYVALSEEVYMFPDEDMKKINKTIKKMIITDHVIFNSTEEITNFENLINIDKLNIGDFYFIPADILITGEIPIYNMQITLKKFNVAEAVNQFVDVNAYIYIYEDCENRIQVMEDGNNDLISIVGYICVTMDCNHGSWYYLPITVPKGSNGLTLSGVYGIYGIDEDIEKVIKEQHIILSEDAYDILRNMTYNSIKLDKDSFKEFTNLASNIIQLWYKIQIALLHPTIKEIFNVSGMETESHKKPSNKNYKKGKKVTKYIKQRVINLNKISDNNREYKRICLAWYVIGHYRQYKNGKRIFIKPYWKGELRDVKTEYEKRTRKIIVE